jgi:hypothetical protein
MAIPWPIADSLTRSRAIVDWLGKVYSTTRSFYNGPLGKKYNYAGLFVPTIRNACVAGPISFSFLLFF